MALGDKPTERMNEMIELKKGDKVILKGFTGIKLGVFEVTSATKKTLSIQKKNGDELVFDRKTGKQINVEEGKEKYANSIIEDDGSFVAPSTKAAGKRKAKKVKNDSTQEETEDPDESEDSPKKAKKQPKKAAKKQPEPEDEPADEPEEDDEEEDDDFEEVD